MKISTYLAAELQNQADKNDTKSAVFQLTDKVWSSLQEIVRAAQYLKTATAAFELSNALVVSVNRQGHIKLTLVAADKTYVNVAPITAQGLFHGMCFANAQSSTGDKGPFIIVSTSDKAKNYAYQLHLHNATLLTEHADVLRRTKVIIGQGHFEHIKRLYSTVHRLGLLDIKHEHMSYCTPLNTNTIWSASIETDLSHFEAHSSGSRSGIAIH